jgi:uncharacterized protein
MRIRAGDVDLVAELRDTPTADVLWMVLPVDAKASRWGHEFYFEVPQMMADLEGDARDVLEVGEIGYWVQGRAVAIFFGPTPASRDQEPRAVTPVNVVGRIGGDVSALDALSDGTSFRLEALVGRDG